VVGILQRAQWLRVIFIFVDPPMLALFSFLFFSLLFFWACLCCFALALDSKEYRVVAPYFEEAGGVTQ
jgi:hypothetical protein